MANKKYVNDSMQNSTFQVNSHKPMDDRLVIRLRKNLMQSETWQLTSNGDVMLYSGIIVNVIDDTDANNGLYSLKNWTKYDKQSWDETDDLTYDADGWKMLTNDNKSDFYIITITETRNSGAYTLTCDKTAEEISNNVLIGGKTPIFRLVVSEFGEYTYPAVLSQMPGSYAEDGEVTGVWYWEATMSYIHNNKKIDYHILSEYYLDGSNDSVSITRDEQAIGDSKIYWCHWDEGNSTVVGLTPLQICQLTSDGCIVKCYFYDGGDRYIYDLISCANYGNDDFWILFCRSGDVNSSECIEYFSSEGWSLYAKTHTPTQSDWNQTNTTAPDYIKNKPTIHSAVTLRTMNHEQLTDSSLGDINIHDGFYFPNATKDADGNWYGAVVIGDQVWMGENLRTTRFSDGTPITNGSPSANNGTLNYSVTEPRYYVSDDDPDTISVIGLEYNGKALLNGDTTSDAVPSGIQGVAPDGWHIPSMGEYDQLLNYVISQKRYLSAAPYDQQSPASHYYKTNSLNEKLLFNSVYAGGDADKYNATGFNWQIITSNNVVIGHVLGTTNTHSFNSSENWNEEQISGCDNVNGTTIEVDNGYSFSDGTNTQYGIHVRCISDLTPIQFRNWYIAQYGSLQHHLTEDNLGDNIYDGYYFPNATQDADGNWYGATVIGDQVWLGENFRCTSLPDGTAIANGSASANNDVELFSPIIPYYYWVGNDQDNTEEYGLKYNFSAITNGESLGNNGIGVKGISPDGWHVPCVDEYDKLLSYISQKENYVELWHGYIRTPVLAKVDFLSSTYYNSLSYNLKQLVNATGFSLNVTALGTCELQAPATINSEAIRALVWFNANNYFRLIYKNADLGSTDGSGLPLRLLSDMTPIQFRNWYVETYGTMQHHLNENIIVNQNYDLYRCVMSYDAWINVMGSGDYPAGTQLFEFTMPTNPYITLNHTDKPNRNPIIISKFNATNGQYEPLPPQQQSFVGLNHLITDAATDDHGAYQFELLPDMVNPVYHVFDIQHGLYAVWHKNGDAEMGNASTIYQGILIGVTTSIGNDTTEIAFMLKIYKNSIQQ